MADRLERESFLQKYRCFHAFNSNERWIAHPCRSNGWVCHILDKQGKLAIFTSTVKAFFRSLQKRAVPLHWMICSLQDWCWRLSWFPSLARTIVETHMMQDQTIKAVPFKRTTMTRHSAGTISDTRCWLYWCLPQLTDLGLTRTLKQQLQPTSQYPLITFKSGLLATSSQKLIDYFFNRNKGTWAIGLIPLTTRTQRTTCSMVWILQAVSSE